MNNPFDPFGTSKKEGNKKPSLINSLFPADPVLEANQLETGQSIGGHSQSEIPTSAPEPLGPVEWQAPVEVSFGTERRTVLINGQSEFRLTEETLAEDYKLARTNTFIASAEQEMPESHEPSTLSVVGETVVSEVAQVGKSVFDTALDWAKDFPGAISGLMEYIAGEDVKNKLPKTAEQREDEKKAGIIDLNLRAQQKDSQREQAGKQAEENRQDADEGLLVGEEQGNELIGVGKSYRKENTNDPYHKTRIREALKKQKAEAEKPKLQEAEGKKKKGVVISLDKKAGLGQAHALNQAA